MKNKKRSSTGHTWRFFRAGGSDQVRIDSAQDLLNIEKLDQKLWAALACPVDNVHFDTTTLSLIDIDGDKRIRANELIAAIKWTGGLLRNPDDMIQCNDSITVGAINDLTDDGKRLRDTVRSSLKVLGKDDNDSISLSEAQDLEKIFSGNAFNGDGIITAESVPDNNLKSIIGEIIQCCGSVVDRSGKQGVNTDLIDTYFCKLKEYLDWKRRLLNDDSLCPLNDKTEAALNILLEVKNKIDDYFARCAIAGYDERSMVHLNGEETAMSVYSSQTISIDCEQLKNMPVAQIKPNRPFSFVGGLNPAWHKKIEQFKNNVVQPVLGAKDALTLEEWQQITILFLPAMSHYQSKPVFSTDNLDITRIEEILSGSAKQDLLSLVEKDSAESITFNSIAMIEKLIRFKRDLFSLCKNFVNFKDFYTQGTNAIFQAGTLYIDQRSCNLCIRINDANKHSLMAAMAGTYLVYCECKRKGASDILTIVAAFTNGDSDNLIVGRNGIFYDRNGNDWDASITKIITNPISLKEAFWLPYKSFVRMIESQVAKRASDAEVQSTDKLTQAAVSTANIDKTKTAQQTPKKLDIGIVAALGVAAGAIGTFAATLFGYMAGIVRLGPFAVAGAVLGLIFLVSGPSMILAFIKLRKRNLGPILDAGGWAINTRAKISVPFGAVLTHTATLPAGSQRDLIDPYAEKKSPWPGIIVTFVILYSAYALCNHYGLISKWTGGLAGLKKEAFQNNGVKKITPDVGDVTGGQH